MQIPFMLSSLSISFALFSSVSGIPNSQPTLSSNSHNDATASQHSISNPQPISMSSPPILLPRTTPNTTALQQQRNYSANGDLIFILGSDTQSGLFKKMFADFHTAALAFAQSPMEGFKIGANMFWVGFNYGAFSLMIYYSDKLSLFWEVLHFFENVWVALHPTSYMMFSIAMTGAVFYLVDMLDEAGRRGRGGRGPRG